MARKRTIHGWNADYKYKSEKYESEEVLVFELPRSGEWKFLYRCESMESALNMINYDQCGRDDKNYICVKVNNFNVVLGKVEKTEISIDEQMKRQSEMWN